MRLFASLTIKIPSYLWGDLHLILLTPKSACVILLGVFVAVLSMFLAKYMDDVKHTKPYLPFLIWILLTRLGDAFLVYYPWHICRRSLFRRQKNLYKAAAILCGVLLTEFVCLLAPNDRDEWENPHKTSFIYRLFFVAHYIIYFIGFYMVPYMATLVRNGIVHAASPTLIKMMQLNDDTNKPPLPLPLPLPPVPSAAMTTTGTTVVVEEEPTDPMTICSPSPYDSMVLPTKPISIKEGEQKHQWFQSYHVGFGVVLYSLAATLAPITTGFGLFQFGPVFIVPVIALLWFDRNEMILKDRGYCMIFPAIQLAVHALPTFFVKSLFRTNTGDSKSIISTLCYYFIMAIYGHVLRLVAYHATNQRAHVALLLLFQVIDVIFSNMVFIGVHDFNGIYFLLLGLTIGRIFIRDSKLPNDLINIFFHTKLYQWTGKKQKEDETIPKIQWKELAILQCTRLRRARQNAMLEIASGFIVPMLFLIDRNTNWNIVVRENERFPDQHFLILSSCLILLTRLTGSSCAWIYLRSIAKKIVHEIQLEKDAVILEQKEIEHQKEIIPVQLNVVWSSKTSPNTEMLTEKPQQSYNSTPLPPTDNVDTLVTATVVVPKRTNRTTSSFASTEMRKIQFKKTRRLTEGMLDLLVLEPVDSYRLLLKENIREGLHEYWDDHFPYLLVCVAYGVFNAVMFIGKVNGQIRDLQKEVPLTN